MSNNSTLAKVKDITPQMVAMAVAEVLQVLHNNELCSMLTLTVANSSPNEKIITGHKVGVLAHLARNERGKWRCLPDSLMTLDEVNTYTNGKFVRKAIVDRQMGVLRESNDEEIPDGLIPAKNAIEICLRKTDFHGLVKDYLENRTSDVVVANTSEVIDLLHEIKSLSCKSMVCAFLDALNNLENGIGVSYDTEYVNYLRKHPLGTDKIKNMLITVVWAIEDENTRLRYELTDPDISGCDLSPLSEKLSSMGKRFTEVPRKFLKKTGDAGNYNTPMVWKAAVYCKNACNHPTYLRE